MLCPECMADARRAYAAANPASVRAARAMRGLRGQPVVTYAAIAICVIVFIVELIGGNAVVSALWFAPAEALVPPISPLIPFEPWRMITSVFTHDTAFPYLHLLLNMFTLFIFGRMLEPALGWLRYAALFLIGGFGGSVGVLIWSVFDPSTAVQPTVGASGAIFALMGAFAVMLHSTGRGATQFWVLIAVNLFIGFLPGYSVSWQAHVGGLITGILFGLILVRTRARLQRTLQSWLIVALAAVLVVIAVIPSFVFQSMFGVAS